MRTAAAVLLLHAASVLGGQRNLTDVERVVCANEIAEVERLQIHYTIGTANRGYALALYQPKGDMTDVVSDHIIKGGAWEESELEGVLETSRRLLRDAHPDRFRCRSPPCHSNVMIDIGANVGSWTFFAASQGIRVIAIEGAPTNVAMLRLSLCLNPSLAGRIELHSRLLGSREGACAMMLPTNNIGDGYVLCDLWGQSVEWNQEQMQIARDGNFVGWDVNRVFSVPMSRLEKVLDDIWASDPKLPYMVNLMKIDIEGSEFRALNASGTWLSAGRIPVIKGEVWDSIDVPGYIGMLTERMHLKVHKGICAKDTIEQPVLDRVSAVPFQKTIQIAELCIHSTPEVLQKPPQYY